MLNDVHFAATADEPFPPIDRLASVEADSPQQAATLLVEAGRVPQNRSLHWARVAISVHPNGVPSLVMRYPITPVRKIPLHSSPARGKTQSMSCEDRTRQLNALRQKSPQRLIATYRAATDTPEPQQLPRGLGFTGMIETILKHEVATGEVEAEKVQAEVGSGEVKDEVARAGQWCLPVSCWPYSTCF